MFDYNETGDSIAVNALKDKGENWGFIDRDVTEKDLVPEHEILDKPFMGDVTANATGPACSRASSIEESWGGYTDW